MHKRCPICHGSGVMYYYVHEPVSVLDYSEPLDLQGPKGPRTKTYPCPECTKQVSFDELRIVETVDSVSVHDLEFAGLRGHIEKSMTSALAAKMHRMGVLHYTFKETGPDYNRVHKFSGAIGVVDKNTTKTYVETLEETRKKAVQDTIDKVLQLIHYDFNHAYFVKEALIREISQISDK